MVSLQAILPTSAPRLVTRSGDPALAEVFVLALRGDDARGQVELVDGLDGRLPREEKWIINVSTQFGCPMGCLFCDAGGGFAGNLTRDDMLAQVRFALDRHAGLAARCAKLKVHFARMGEPALNDAVLDTLEVLPEETGAPALWGCVATTAPAGRDRWFERLMEVKNARYPGRFQLQFSVNATDEDARRRLMRGRLRDIGWIAEYAARFHGPHDRKVVANFALARGVPFDPAVLVGTFDPARVAVKLTPLNPTRRGREHGLASVLRAPGAEDLQPALDTLAAAGFDVIVSVGAGDEDRIGSNCGQSVRRAAGS